MQRFALVPDEAESVVMVPVAVFVAAAVLQRNVRRCFDPIGLIRVTAGPADRAGTPVLRRQAVGAPSAGASAGVFGFSRTSLSRLRFATASAVGCEQDALQLRRSLGRLPNVHAARGRAILAVGSLLCMSALFSW
ncbi:MULTISPECIES: hypothetical protein [unclassified Streptomyces]|uniref:hypothetical protein n=1 Tax=unclassified Streptomyces TaxID=2593676 RepID=UPI00381496B6